MIGIYFSGTGNTKYCIEKFISICESNINAIALENKTVLDEIKKEQDIILAYPIYYSNLPKIVRDFIEQNNEIWKDKNIFIICTMGLFSGDGAGVSARLLKKYGATIIGGFHIKMPDCICDVKVLKRSSSENKKIIQNANDKLKHSVQMLKNGKTPKEGLNFLYHLAGLFGQRLWFFHKTRYYSTDLHIDKNTCIGCGKCISLCPMKNLAIRQGEVYSSGKCTMCYRCINYCPKKAITLIGHKVITQKNLDDYIN